MTVTINGTTGIDTPAITNNGAYTGDGVVFADGTPSNTLVTDTGGNIGIGTDSPISQLHLNKWGTSDYTTLRLSNGGTSGRAYVVGVGGNAAASGYENSLYFYDATAAEQRMVINSSGNVGIGTGSPSGASGAKVLNMYGVGNSQTIVEGGSGTSFLVTYSGTSSVDSSSIYFNKPLRFGTATAKDATGFIERMRIDTSGNVGIGTSTVTLNTTGTAVHINNNNANFAAIARYTNGTTGSAAAQGAFTGLWSDNDLYMWSYYNNNLIFGNNSGPKLTINTSGYMVSPPTWARATTGGNYLGIFSDGSFYNVSSSIKYKKDIEDLNYSIVDNVIKNLRPRWYRLKEPQGDVQPNWSHIGLIAEEVDLIEPRLTIYKTMETKEVEESVLDAEGNQTLDSDGNPVLIKKSETVKLATPEPQSVDYALLSVICLSELQKQRETIGTLKAELDSLRSEISTLKGQ